MSVESYIKKMPKVELHVHLEGSIRPETFLMLAERHQIALPAKNLEGLRAWYQFSDFSHFIAVYLKIAESLKTPEDIELIAREFLRGQAAQHVVYSEVIYSPYNQFLANAIPFDEQLDALTRAQTWAQETLGIQCQWIMDISRETTPEQGLTVAKWAIDAKDQGVCALGLGGPEVGHPPEKFKAAFDLAYDAGLAAIPHAGETVGPESIWGALNHLHPRRIEHGVRCLEDPDLVKELRERQMPLDVCPTSNTCLHVFPSFSAHPLKRMIEEDLFVTLNSDDPPLFNTTLQDEYLKAFNVLGLSPQQLNGLVKNAVEAAVLPEGQKAELLEKIAAEESVFRRQALDG